MMTQSLCTGAWNTFHRTINKEYSFRHVGSGRPSIGSLYRLSRSRSKSYRISGVPPFITSLTRKTSNTSLTQVQRFLSTFPGSSRSEFNMTVMSMSISSICQRGDVVVYLDNFTFPFTLWHNSFECLTGCLLFGLLFLVVSIVNFLSHHEESDLQRTIIFRAVLRSSSWSVSCSGVVVWNFCMSSSCKL
jgi:hypothetical protein